MGVGCLSHKNLPHPDIQQLSGSSGFGGTFTPPSCTSPTVPFGDGGFFLEDRAVLRRVDANVMGWGFGAVVLVGKAVGVECDVWVSVILGGMVDVEEEEEEGEDGVAGGGGGGDGGVAPCGGGGTAGRPRWRGLA